MAKDEGECCKDPGTSCCCFVFVLIPLVSMLTGFGWADGRYECVSLEPIKDQLLPASFTSLNAIDIKSIHTHMDSEDLLVYNYGVLAEGDLVLQVGSMYIKTNLMQSEYLYEFKTKEGSQYGDQHEKMMTANDAYRQRYRSAEREAAKLKSQPIYANEKLSAWKTFNNDDFQCNKKGKCAHRKDYYLFSHKLDKIGLAKKEVLSLWNWHLGCKSDYTTTETTIYYCAWPMSNVGIPIFNYFFGSMFSSATNDEL